MHNNKVNFQREFGQNFTVLQDLASQALMTNLIRCSRGSYFRAGPNQFGSLWTRDFCHAVPGILALDSAKLNLAVRDHLSLLLNNLQIGTDLAPRMFDSFSSKARVAAHTIFKPLALYKFIPPITDKLKPEYLSEHGTRALDSNILILRAAAAYLRKTNDLVFLKSHEPSFKRCLDFYQDKLQAGLVQQGKYEDWQDTAKRQGFSSYLNLLIYFTLRDDLAVLQIKANTSSSSFKARIIEAFYDPPSGLLRGISGKDQISLESNLFAIRHNFWDSCELSSAHWEKLKKHPLLAVDLPGRANFPDFPWHQISIPAHVVGLRHYHDALVWTWLVAESVSTAIAISDLEFAKTTLSRLQTTLNNAGGVCEILDISGKPFANCFYRSEQPFTWAAGKILEALF